MLIQKVGLVKQRMIVLFMLLFWHFAVMEVEPIHMMLSQCNDIKVSVTNTVICASDPRSSGTDSVII